MGFFKKKQQYKRIEEMGVPQQQQGDKLPELTTPPLMQTAQSRTYNVEVVCENCGKDQFVEIQKGVLIDDMIDKINCINCENKTLKTKDG